MGGDSGEDMGGNESDEGGRGRGRGRGGYRGRGRGGFRGRGGGFRGRGRGRGGKAWAKMQERAVHKAVWNVNDSHVRRVSPPSWRTYLLHLKSVHLISVRLA